MGWKMKAFEIAGTGAKIAGKAWLDNKVANLGVVGRAITGVRIKGEVEGAQAAMREGHTLEGALKTVKMGSDMVTLTGQNAQVANVARTAANVGLSLAEILAKK